MSKVDGIPHVGSIIGGLLALLDSPRRAPRVLVYSPRDRLFHHPVWWLVADRGRLGCHIAHTKFLRAVELAVLEPVDERLLQTYPPCAPGYNLSIRISPLGVKALTKQRASEAVAALRGVPEPKAKRYP